MEKWLCKYLDIHTWSDWKLKNGIQVWRDPKSRKILQKEKTTIVIRECKYCFKQEINDYII